MMYYYPIPYRDYKDIHSFDLNTLILKGTSDGFYELAAENQNANTYTSYDGSVALEAGDGWFKLTRARGTAGGYVFSYFFEYDLEKEDWFFNTYYSNWFGYIEEGRSMVQTPDNFGIISFEDFNKLLTCIGRLSYPLFLFCMVWGYHYTRNRKVYLLRLYLGSLFMTVFAYAIDFYLPTDGFGYGNHNIFLNMFWVRLLVSTVETFQKDRKRGGIMLGAIFAV